MQLVGTHYVLRLLGNLPVAGRQKLGAYRSGKHVQQNLAKPLVPASIRIIAHQMTHQSLWHGDVHAVHGHVVAVICSPPQGKLRHVASAYDHASHSVRHVHEDLRPLPGLTVFIGHVVDILVLTHVPEVEPHRLGYGDLHKLRPDGANQAHRIFVGPVRGAESRHGDGHYAPSVKTGQIEGLRRHQQCQGGIQPARNPHHRMGSVGMHKPLF